MRLTRTERAGMIHTTTKVTLARLENLCQAAYREIEWYQKKIKDSQDFLERCEPEYLKCKALLESLEEKQR